MQCTVHAVEHIVGFDLAHDRVTQRAVLEIDIARQFIRIRVDDEVIASIRADFGRIRRAEERDGRDEQHPGYRARLENAPLRACS